jgi:hypothetical protein
MLIFFIKNLCNVDSPVITFKYRDLQSKTESYWLWIQGVELNPLFYRINGRIWGIKFSRPIYLPVSGQCLCINRYNQCGFRMQLLLNFAGIYRNKEHILEDLTRSRR